MDYSNKEKARKYTEAQELFYSKHPDFTREQLRRLMGEVQGVSILDLGCGCGVDVAAYTKMGGTVTGLDKSGAMIELAKERYPQLSDQFVTSDFTQGLPFSDNQFHLVYARYALHYAKELDGVFSEIHRVLKPGGFLVVCVAHPLLGFIAKGGKDYFDKIEFELPLYNETVTIIEASHTFGD